MLGRTGRKEAPRQQEQTEGQPDYGLAHAAAATRSIVDGMLSAPHQAQIARIIKTLRAIVPWTGPEVMCVLTVGTVTLGLPILAFLQSDAAQSITPLQKATGHVVSIQPEPIDEQGIAGLNVKFEVCGRVFNQGTVAATHRGLKVGMFFPVTFRIPYEHGEPKEMLADFFFARDIGPVQSDEAICSQLRKPWW